MKTGLLGIIGVLVSYSYPRLYLVATCIVIRTSGHFDLFFPVVSVPCPRALYYYQIGYFVGNFATSGHHGLFGPKITVPCVQRPQYLRSSREVICCRGLP